MPAEPVLIPLTRGLFAAVDADVAPELLGYSWQASKGRKTDETWYARRAQKRDDGSYVYVQMHRQIMGAPKGFDVDHIDGDGLNNVRSNLRVCTHAQNGANQRTPKNNTSGYKGVCLERRSGTWHASVGRQFLGMYDTAEEAARAYDTAARAMYGEFAKLNFPGEDVRVEPRKGGVWRTNTSGVKGVKQTPYGKWLVQFTSGGVKHYLGCYATRDEAAEVLRKKREELGLPV